MQIFICNSLSLSMLDPEVQQRDPAAKRGMPRIPRPVMGAGCPAGSAAAARQFLAAWEDQAEIVSAVGHADTARMFSNLLGREVQVNRMSVKLIGSPDGDAEHAQTALIGQYTGPRLPEGATTLPEGAEITWWII